MKDVVYVSVLSEHNILFKIPQGLYYELSFGLEGKLFLTYMPSLEISAHDDIETIVCNPYTENEEINYSGMYTDTQGTDSIYREPLFEGDIVIEGEHVTATFANST